MTAITTVISDFGGVLTSPLLGAFTTIQEETGLDDGALGGALARAADQDGVNPLYELECGRLTERDFFARLSAQLREDLGRDVSLPGFSERYFALLEPNAAMIGELRALRDGGLRVGLLTNNVREWKARWRAMLPIDELFDVVVDSAFVGMRKPDPEIYRLTCERLGVEPAECLFVDDLQPNCDAATGLGMTAVRLRGTDQAIAEIRAALGAGPQLSEPSRSQR